MKRVLFSCIVAAILATVPTKTSAESATFDSDGVKIHYVIEGEGEPVLLIHGYNASHFSNWVMPGAVGTLKKDYQVIAIDNRGHGKSDRPENKEAYGENMVDDAVRLLDHLGIESAHVVGYSMGGMITMKMMVDHPDRVRSGVVGGMGWVQPVEGREYWDAREGVETVSAAVYQGMYRLNITKDELKDIEVPFTIIIGENDGILESRVRPLQKVRPDVPVVIVPTSNHSNCIFKKEFKQGIKDFVDSQAHRDS